MAPSVIEPFRRLHLGNFFSKFLTNGNPTISATSKSRFLKKRFVQPLTKNIHYVFLNGPAEACPLLSTMEIFIRATFLWKRNTGWEIFKTFRWWICSTAQRNVNSEKTSSTRCRNFVVHAACRRCVMAAARKIDLSTLRMARPGSTISVQDTKCFFHTADRLLNKSHESGASSRFNRKRFNLLLQSPAHTRWVVTIHVPVAAAKSTSTVV